MKNALQGTTATLVHPKPIFILYNKANANFRKGHKNVVKMLIYAWLARADERSLPILAPVNMAKRSSILKLFGMNAISGFAAMTIGWRPFSMLSDGDSEREIRLNLGKHESESKL